MDGSICSRSLKKMAEENLELNCVAPNGKERKPCGAGLGEALAPMRLVGVFLRWDDRHRVARPRDVRRCRKCGWYSVYQPLLDTGAGGS